jgi:hypothetical protein
MRLPHSRAISPTTRTASVTLGALLRNPGALAITALAASDLAYRLLIRGFLRRALGLRS